MSAGRGLHLAAHGPLTQHTALTLPDDVPHAYARQKKVACSCEAVRGHASLTASLPYRTPQGGGQPHVWQRTQHDVVYVHAQHGAALC